MAAGKLSPGVHTFPFGQNTLSYHITPSKIPNSRLWIQQAISWGPGRCLYVNTLAPLLSEHFTVLDFSPRGSDESTRPRDAAGNDDASQMSCTHVLADLEALREHLGLDAFDVLCGHSQAGVPILLYAALYPTKVQNLIPIGTLVLGFDNSKTFAHYREIRSPLPPWQKSYEAWTRFRETPPKTDEEFGAIFTELVPSYLTNPERDTAAVRDGLLGDSASPPRVWLYNAVTPSYAVDEHASDMLDILANIQARVLFSHGEHDMVCSADAVSLAEKNMKGGSAKEVRVHMLDIGHFPWIESKDKFLRGVFDFLGV